MKLKTKLNGLEIGKRYRCSKCGSEFIVTRGGKGTISCCGQLSRR